MGYNNMKQECNRMREEKNNVINEMDIQKKLSRTLEMDKTKLVNELTKTMSSDTSPSRENNTKLL